MGFVGATPRVAPTAFPQITLKTPMTTERLQKFLSRAGVASRRAAEEYIQAGRVAVNGEVVTAMGLKVDPERDVVKVDGRAVKVTAAPRTVSNANGACQPTRAISHPAVGTPMSPAPAHDSSVMPIARPRCS